MSKSYVENPWPFADPPNHAAFTTTHFLDLHKPILYVSHESAEGDWQFLWGGPVSMEDMKIVCLKHIFARDPSISEVADLPRGWYAERSSISSPWLRQQIPPDED